MKKRKSPVLLVSAMLILGFGAVLVLPSLTENSGSNKGGHDHGHDHDTPSAAKESSVVGEARATLPREALAQKIREQVDEKPGDVPADMIKSQEPSIALPGHTRSQAPKPDESSTSSMWYAPESMVNDKADR